MPLPLLDEDDLSTDITNMCLYTSPKQSNVEVSEDNISSNEVPKDEFENVLETLKIQNSFLQANKMCDVTLIANDGVQIPAHKVILSSSSQFFLSKFDNDEFDDKKKQILQLNEIDSNTLRTIINYIYTYKLNMTENNIVDIFKAIHFFQLKRLNEKCCDFIENNLNFTNCISLMKFAKVISYDRLYNLCFSYVLENLFKLDVSLLNQLSYKEIKTLISNNSLKTESEEQVFIFVLNWTKFEESIRKKYLPELMKHIRLSFVSKTFISNVLNEPLLKDYTIMKYMIEYLSDPDFKHDKRSSIILNNESLINKSDILMAIENRSGRKFQYQYSDISSGLLQWNIGSNFFQPPYSESKIVGFNKTFLFSIGGVNLVGCQNMSVNRVYILDLSTSSKKWIETASMISSRYDHAVCTHDNRIFAVGGIDKFGQTLNTIEVFDINTKIWSLYCTMSNQRRNCSAIYHKNFLYIIGGKNGNGQILSTVECFNDLSKTWSNHISSLPQALYDTCITIYKNNLYVVGGAKTVIQYSHYKESSHLIYKYALLQHYSGWSTLRSILNSRHLASCAVIDEKLYIFGGLNNNSSYEQSIEILDLENNKFSTQKISLTHAAQNIIILNKLT